MIFQVLIVDDEPHVVESISALLEEQCTYALELHAANRAQHALKIMKQGRIDLLLTDIQMPGTNGLELIREVRSLWPECVTVILSAYSQFEYAYEAMSYNVAGYILKTEEESDIIKRLNALFAKMEADLNHREWLAHAAETSPTDAICDSLFMKMLYDAELDEAATKATLLCIGFAPEGSGYIPLIVQAHPGETINTSLLRNAMEHYLRAKLHRFVMVPLMLERIFILLQFEEVADSFINTFERLQDAVLRTSGQELSFIVGKPWSPSVPLCRIRNNLKRSAMRLENHFELCVMEMDKSTVPNRITVDFLKEYINAHINEDLSLTYLSKITGYNASYLSRIFSTEANKPLVRYIAIKRMDAIRRLMLNPALSLDQIMTMSQFNSRSYFNSFIKKETGLAPKKYRAQVCMNASELE